MTTDATGPACVSRELAGMLFAEGRVLLVSNTADNLAWARRTWMSIRAHAAEPGRSEISPAPVGGPRPN